MLPQLHTRLLDLYKIFKQVCEDNDLRFFAAYGTAIGAVRHKGIIPWDDDIDIEMPWGDYNKLINLAPKSLPEGIKFSNGMNIGEGFIFCKVFEEKSTFFISHMLDNPNAYTGVYIDIFPLIGAPNNKNKHDDFALSCNKLIDNVWHARLLKKPTEEAKYVAEYTDLCGKYSYDTAQYVRGGYAPTALSKVATYPSEWYESYEEMQFEDTTIRVPIGYDSLLREIYGEYMKLPPKGARVSHLEFSLLDLKNSYHKYVDLVLSQEPVISDYITLVNRTLHARNSTVEAMGKDIRLLQDKIYRLEKSLISQGNEIEELEGVLRAERFENSLAKARLEALGSVKASGRLFVGNIGRRLKKYVRAH